jgi:hypothetical protein
MSDVIYLPSLYLRNIAIHERCNIPSITISQKYCNSWAVLYTFHHYISEILQFMSGSRSKKQMLEATDRQRFSKHISVTTGRQQKFSMVTDRLDKEPCREERFMTLFLGDISTGTWPSRLGEFRMWDSKMWSWSPRDSDLRMTELARTSSNCKRQTYPLVRNITATVQL